jgi:hypothetical protein
MITGEDEILDRFDSRLGSLRSDSHRISESMKELGKKQLERIEKAERVEEQILQAKLSRLAKIKSQLSSTTTSTAETTPREVEKKEIKKPASQRKISSEK